MLSWNTIAYGAALSALLAALVAATIGRERRPAVLAVITAGTFAGPVAWNAILRTTSANQFFHDAPIAVFPVSWQDTGSGVFTLAALTLLLGLGPMRSQPAHRMTLLALLGGLSALVVDIYLY